MSKKQWLKICIGANYKIYRLIFDYKFGKFNGYCNIIEDNANRIRFQPIRETDDVWWIDFDKRTERFLYSGLEATDKEINVEISLI